MSRRFPASVRVMRVLCAAFALSGLMLAAQRARAAEPTSPCPRPAPGSAVPEPENVRSRDGELYVDLSVRNGREPDGSVRYCYVLPDGAESPTLRARPGDLVVITLHNQLVELGDGLAPHVHMHAAPQAAVAPADPCTSGATTAVSTNSHSLMA